MDNHKGKHSKACTFHTTLTIDSTQVLGSYVGAFTNMKCFTYQAVEYLHLQIRV